MAQPTDDTPGESAKPCITKEQFESEEYTWNKDKKSKVLLFVFNTGRNKGGKLYERKPSEKEERNLEKCFRKLLGDVDFRPYRNRKVTELPAIFDKEFQDDEGNMEYNCFIFIMLSVGENDRIFCYDNEITITNFIEPIKRKQSMALKPKLFFIQNGDERFTGSVKGEREKGPEPLEFVRSIPQEADFFIMQSNIPESLFPHTKLRDTNECIFMKYLIETIVEDVKQEPGMIPLDIHKLSLRINARVNKRLVTDSNKDRPPYFDILPIPEVTSTLTKALYFPCIS